MEQLKKLEVTIAGWYKNAPHLPLNSQKWLTENAWWIVLVGVILSVFGVFSILAGTLFAGTLLTVFGGVVGAALGGVILVAVFVGLAFSVLEIVFAAMAIAPLKDGKKKGWNYLFVVYLLAALAVVVGFLFHLNVNGFMGLLWGVVWLVIEGYFLFEVRRYMLKTKPTAHPPKSAA